MIRNNCNGLSTTCRMSKYSGRTSESYQEYGYQKCCPEKHCTLKYEKNCAPKYWQPKKCNQKFVNQKYSKLL